MGYILLGFLLLELILLTLWGGFLGFLIAFICMAPPLYYLYKRELKHEKDESETRDKVGKQNLMGLFGIFFLTFFIAFPFIESREKKEFEEYEESHLTYSSSENFDIPSSEKSISEMPDEPYVGMSHDLIDKTGWGNYDKKETLEHLRGDLYRYTWYFCEDDRQYTRTVVVKGEVYDVSSPDMGIPIENINSEFVKCPK